MAKSTYAPKPADEHAANVAELKKRIKEGNVAGSYVFYGCEEYLKRHYYSELLKKCGDTSLNVRTFYQEDFTLEAFINACSTAAADMGNSLFGSSDSASGDDGACRMVKVMGIASDALTKSDEKYFLSMLEDACDGTIIVFWISGEDEQKLSGALYKKIAAKSLCVNFRREENGSNVLISWILRHFSRAKINADRSVVVYFNNYVGNDMTDLKNEIDKCISFLQYEKRDTLTKEDVDFICKKSTSAQIFDISSGAIKGNYAAAMAAYKVFRDSGEKALLLFGTISKAVYDLCMVDKLSKTLDNPSLIAKQAGLRDFVVRNYLGILKARSGREYDSKSYAQYAADVIMRYDNLLKSSRTDQYELLEELIFKLAVGK